MILLAVVLIDSSTIHGLPTWVREMRFLDELDELDDLTVESSGCTTHEIMILAQYIKKQEARSTKHEANH